jgi:sulfur-carrier protein adenylyltransferase/sulfurtransferase
MGDNKYHRQKIVPEFGQPGQDKLKNSKVLMIGCGGLGCPAAMYLTRAGILDLVLVDGDKVSETNLHRQILFDEDDIGRPKVYAAEEKLKKGNSDINIASVYENITVKNVIRLIKDCDVVLDGSDNFDTKYLVNQACVEHKKPMIYGAVNRFEGQMTVFNLALKDNGYSSNMNHLFPVRPSATEVGNCEENGVIGSVAGLIGEMMATECIKIITSIGDPMINRLMMVDTKYHRYHFMDYSKRSSNQQAHVNPGELQWKLANEEMVKANNWQLYDVRSTVERDEYHRGGIHIEPSSETLKNLPPQPVPVFYCLSGSRAEKAMNEFLEFNPNAEAYYINEQLIQ